MLDLTEADEFLRTAHTEGLSEGIREGALAALGRPIERKLRRQLTEGERLALLRRVEADGASAVGEAVFDLDASALAAWLAG